MQKYIEIFWLQDYNHIYCICLLVIDFLDQYKTIHCKSTNKTSVYNKWYHTNHNSLKNLDQSIDKFTKISQCSNKASTVIDLRGSCIRNLSKIFCFTFRSEK